jgi:hypothetical protein
MLLKETIAEIVEIFRGVFCAGNPPNVQSACHGDSGGAMLKFVPNVNDVDEQSHFVQIGNCL